MNTTVNTNDVIIQAPKVEKFADRPTCPACGHREHFRISMFLRNFFGFPTYSAIQRRYCRGGKPPSEALAVPGLPSAMAESLGFERKFECAGVYRPHHHMTCGRCQYDWFSETANGRG